MDKNNHHHHHRHHDDVNDNEDDGEEILLQIPFQQRQELKPQRKQQQQQKRQRQQYANANVDGAAAPNDDGTVADNGAHHEDGVEGLSPPDVRIGNQQHKSMELHALWLGGLEVLIHQLLYIRYVYPQSSFTLSRFLHTQCHICRHQGVVRYISKALQVAVSSIIQPLPYGTVHPDHQENERHHHQHQKQQQPRPQQRYVVDEMWIEIYDQMTMVPHERYVLSFSDRFREVVSRWILSSNSGGRVETSEVEQDDSVTGPIEEANDDNYVDEEGGDGTNDDDIVFDEDDSDSDSAGDGDEDHDRISLDVFERDLRDLICSVGTLRGVERLTWPDSTSFRILLSTKTGITATTTSTSMNHEPDNRCMVIDTTAATTTTTTTTSHGSVYHALASATWFRASSPSNRGEQSKRRTVYSIPNTGCQFQYQIL
jgi:hypothetical protein